MTDKARRSRITVFTQLLHIYSDVERRHDVFLLPDLPNATDSLYTKYYSESLSPMIHFWCFKLKTLETMLVWIHQFLKFRLVISKIKTVAPKFFFSFLQQIIYYLYTVEIWRKSTGFVYNIFMWMPLITGSEGNNSFLFPRISMFPKTKSKGNRDSKENNKLTVSRGPVIMFLKYSWTVV